MVPHAAVSHAAPKLHKSILIFPSVPSEFHHQSFLGCSDGHDCTALYRNSEMHEATRRLLGVLLRHLDGFETNKRSVVIAATNRKEDLDPALLSRSPVVLPPHLDHCWL